MDKINVLVLVGGICRESLNKRLFSEMKKHYNGKLDLSSFDIEKLPYYSQDIESEGIPVVEEFKSAIRNAQAVLLITPEYNRSFPGVLKNALDWGSRPWGQSLWNKKPVGIAGVTISTLGAYGAQEQLKTVCGFLNMPIMNHPEFYGNAALLLDENGLKPEAVPFVQNYFDEFEKWVISNSSL